MAFWKVCFLMWQLIGLGVAQSDGPVPPVELREFEEIRRASCPTSYEVCGNFCYRVFTDLKTWTEAEAECIKNQTDNPKGQAHLVSILNQQENDFVVDLWRATNPPKTGCSRTPWIGLSDNDSDNIGFIWSDGKPFGDYDNLKCQPNTNPKQLCVSLRRGFWKTNSCERKMPFICKVPL
ncbi:snaclec purpureotin subunit alpha-like [Asterias amurensis]|uniref:snaclec purpureotin subunit alpha-like n=1 Tax=Asterias amurensis TaxID=7602 RepID=UPI003AB781C2